MRGGRVPAIPEGASLEFPDGSVYTFTNAPADPEREPLEMEFLLPPDCLAPPPHTHPAGQRESYEVLEGAFEVLRGSDWHRLEAGQSMTIEAGEVTIEPVGAMRPAMAALALVGRALRLRLPE